GELRTDGVGPMQVTEDEVVNAIRWKLGISVDSNDARYREIWERLRTSTDVVVQEQLNRVCRFLSGLMEQVVRSRLQLLRGTLPADDQLTLDTLWTAFEGWVRGDPMKRSPRVSRLLKDAIAAFKTQPAATTAVAVARTPPPAARVTPP